MTTTPTHAPWRTADDLNRLAHVEALLADPAVPALFVTGAGISAAAGLPTFRDSDGVYNTGAMRPLRAGMYNSKTIHLLWNTIGRVLGANRLTPTPAHNALAKFAARRANTTIVTQNIDGLHTVAGGVAIELHGSARRAACLAPGCGQRRQLDDETYAAAVIEPSPASVPRCECGARMRPDVTLFGENLPTAAIAAAVEAAAAAEVVVAVGTSLSVYPAAALILDPAAAGVPGAWVDPNPHMSKNAEPSDVAAAERLVKVVGPANQALPILIDEPPF